MSNRPVSAGKAWAEHWKQLLPESGVHKYSHKHAQSCSMVFQMCRARLTCSAHRGQAGKCFASHTVSSQKAWFALNPGVQYTIHFELFCAAWIECEWIDLILRSALFRVYAFLRYMLAWDVIGLCNMEIFLRCYPCPPHLCKGNYELSVTDPSPYSHNLMFQATDAKGHLVHKWATPVAFSEQPSFTPSKSVLVELLHTVCRGESAGNEINMLMLNNVLGPLTVSAPYCSSLVTDNSVVDAFGVFVCFLFFYCMVLVLLDIKKQKCTISVLSISPVVPLYDLLFLKQLPEMCNAIMKSGLVKEVKGQGSLTVSLL